MFETTQDFERLLVLVELIDKQVVKVAYNTRIKFYEVFKLCQDQDLRSDLFAKLNQNVLKGEEEGNRRRKLAETFGNLKDEGKDILPEKKSALQLSKRKVHKINNKKLSFKDYFDNELEQKDYLPSTEELKEAK